MTHRLFLFAAFTACLSLGTPGGASAAAGTKLVNGAGATFPYPLYSKWFSEFNKTNPLIEINYQSIGSGGGIKQLLAKTVQFGASDAPMSDAELKSAPAPVVHLPMVLGAVAITYNLPEAKAPLKLSADVLADIFLGAIKKWNDPRLSELNPGVALPAQDIAVVARADSSGTTYVFTDYLGKVSSKWKSQVGVNKTIKWPVGLASMGNDGVTGQLKNTPGSIGYVELVYAVTQKLPVAELKNRAGTYVAPSVKSVTEAAAGSMNAMPADYRVSITDAAGAGAYPISAFTYILVYKSMDKDLGAPLVQFLNWAMVEGQKTAPGMSYAPLPASMVAKVKATIKGLEIK